MGRLCIVLFLGVLSACKEKKKQQQPVFLWSGVPVAAATQTCRDVTLKPLWNLGLSLVAAKKTKQKNTKKTKREKPLPVLNGLVPPERSCTCVSHLASHLKSCSPAHPIHSSVASVSVHHAPFFLFFIFALYLFSNLSNFNFKYFLLCQSFFFFLLSSQIPYPNALVTPPEEDCA